jgi:hypothetical protein
VWVPWRRYSSGVEPGYNAKVMRPLCGGIVELWRRRFLTLESGPMHRSSWYDLPESEQWNKRNGGTKPKVKQKRMMQILDLDDGRSRTNHWTIVRAELSGDQRGSYAPYPVHPNLQWMIGHVHWFLILISMVGPPGYVPIIFPEEAICLRSVAKFGTYWNPTSRHMLIILRSVNKEVFKIKPAGRSCLFKNL